MTLDDQVEQERVWGLLFDGIREVMQKFGKEDSFGKADYLLVDDNYGFHRHTVELQNLRMLQPALVKSLQQLIGKLPKWEIVLAVDVPGKEGVWPPMGLTIRQQEIIDGLRRDFLPKEFQDLKFGGSRPGTGYD
jgi:hypothetical protein